MLTFPPSVRVFVATQPIDGRKGAYSLAAMVRNVFDHDVLSGSMYVFFTRRRDRVRVLYWDRSGFALWTKCLEQGCYRPPLSPDGTLRATEIEYAELALVLEGIELAGSRRRPRWVPQKPASLAMLRVAARSAGTRASNRSAEAARLKSVPSMARSWPRGVWKCHPYPTLSDRIEGACRFS